MNAKRPAFWNDQAADFDDEPDHGLGRPETREAWRTLLSDHLDQDPSDIVDLGCGTGSLSLLLAQAGHRVRGLDFAGEMVTAARNKATAAGETIDFLVGDAALPPYAPGSVDVVLCRHVLWALPDPDAALGAWVRLLRPGGRVLLVEGRWHTGGGIDAAQCRRLAARHLSNVDVQHLTDEVYWGGPINDERYLLVGS